LEDRAFDLRAQPEVAHIFDRIADMTEHKASCLKLPNIDPSSMKSEYSAEIDGFKLAGADDHILLIWQREMDRTSQRRHAFGVDGPSEVRQKRSGWSAYGPGRFQFQPAMRRLLS
jgi:hypothetical protein